MAALITVPIPPQNYETVRNQIGAILLLELTEQQSLDNTFTAPTVWNERMVAFDKTEVPAINVCLYKGDYDRKSNHVNHGTYVYVVYAYTNSASTDDTIGDTLSAIALQQLMGKIRAILDNPCYRTLGFTPGTGNNGTGIEGSRVTGIMIAESSMNGDSLNTTEGRVFLEVKVPEGTQLAGGSILNLVTNTVTLGTTAYGYQYNLPQTD